MKALALLLTAVTSLSAESPIGLSVPLSIEPIFNKGLPAIRLTLLQSEGAARLTKAAHENGTEIFAVISAEEDESKSLAAFGEFVTHFEILPPTGLDPRQTNSAFEYVQRLTLSHKAARKTNPAARTGISIAQYDLQFLDACLRDGAVGQFDFVSLSPFPVSPGTDRLMPGALTTVRKLLTHHGLPSEIPVHITLSGAAAELVVTAASARAAGFDQIFIETDAELLAKIPDKSHPNVPKSYSESPSVSITLSETNQANGLEQLLPSDTPWDPELKAKRLHLTASSPVFRTAFLADPTFFAPDRKTYEITVEAKRLPSDDGLQNPTALSLTYEATHGLRTATFWPVPGDNKWHTHSWKVTDARFTGKLGWHFLFDASGAGNDVLIREVIVSK